MILTILIGNQSINISIYFVLWIYAIHVFNRFIGAWNKKSTCGTDNTFLRYNTAVVTYMDVHLQSNKCSQFDNVGLVGYVKLWFFTAMYKYKEWYFGKKKTKNNNCIKMCMFHIY